MPYGYLFTVAVLAFVTATAVIGPRPAHTTQNFWGFWATFLINELPFLALYVLAASSVLALVQGDLLSPGGLAGLAVAVFTAGGLVVLIRRALATRAVLAGIGLAPGPVRWAHVLLAPLAVRRWDVTRAGKIAYGDAGRRNLLDVYHRRDRPTGGPVLVYFHGGGFHSGHNRREGRALLYRLAARGWVCVSANYRFSGYPDAHADAERVVAWVRAHAAEYGGDPATVCVSGSSAGGHLAAMTALADPSISGAIGFYGYYGRVAGPGSSPLDLVRDAPPFLFLHGDLDSSTLVEDTREFVSRLREASRGPVFYAELPGAQHSFDLFYSLRYSQLIDAVEAFGATLVKA
ncbi:alpha/beta hydrolase [Cryptosporangium sp. NPDC051539]|uniref:alpha/beta hydrolase n=1 Tax=Cryptosporangium sp. NPDC051539 TaxID=3363962 RepID=UPI003791D45E